MMPCAGQRQRRRSTSSAGGGNVTLIKEKAGKIWGIVGKVPAPAPSAPAQMRTCHLQIRMFARRPGYRNTRYWAIAKHASHTCACSAWVLLTSRYVERQEEHSPLIVWIVRRLRALKAPAGRGRRRRPGGRRSWRTPAGGRASCRAPPPRPFWTGPHPPGEGELWFTTSHPNPASGATLIRRIAL